MRYPTFFQVSARLLDKNSKGVPLNNTVLSINFQYRILDIASYERTVTRSDVCLQLDRAPTKYEFDDSYLEVLGEYGSDSKNNELVLLLQIKITNQD